MRTQKLSRWINHQQVQQANIRQGVEGNTQYNPIHVTVAEDIDEG